MDEEFQKPEGYIPRIVDAQLERYLKVFGAVEVTGTRWCGKTWTSLMHAKSAVYVDRNLALANSDPSMMLLGERPHVIDEWQLVPAIWDAARHEVDKQASTRGAFILTGSSTPLEETTAPGVAPGVLFASSYQTPTHSGAGRIGRIRMHPMSLSESGDSCAEISLAGLFEGDFKPCKAPADTLKLINAACKGGWPEALPLKVEDAQLLARDYLNVTYSRSIGRLGLDGEIARRMVASLARNLGQPATYKTIVGDMFGAEENPEEIISEGTVRSYLDALKRLYLLEEVPGWAPPMRSKKRFGTKPKRYLADPSLACAALGASLTAFLNDWQTFGLVFENMAIRDLSVYARSLDLLDDTPVRYYRDDSGLEADAIIQLADGRWAAFEIKLGEDKVPEAIKKLKRLREKVTSNPKAHNSPPTFMAVITGTGEFARMVEEGIYVIPLRALTC